MVKGMAVAGSFTIPTFQGKEPGKDKGRGGVKGGVKLFQKSPAQTSNQFTGGPS